MKLEGKERQTVVPDAEESRIFWNDIWGQPVRHNENAEWLRTLEEELVDIGIQENIQINLIKLKKQITRIPNWKSPGPDGVQGYWIKNLSAMHDRMSNQYTTSIKQPRFGNLSKFLPIVLMKILSPCSDLAPKL